MNSNRFRCLVDPGATRKQGEKVLEPRILSCWATSVWICCLTTYETVILSQRRKEEEKKTKGSEIVKHDLSFYHIVAKLRSEILRSLAKPSLHHATPRSSRRYSV